MIQPIRSKRVALAAAAVAFSAALVLSPVLAQRPQPQAPARSLDGQEPASGPARRHGHGADDAGREDLAGPWRRQFRGGRGRLQRRGRRDRGHPPAGSCRTVQLADSAVGVRAAAERGRYATLLPSAIGEAATWDPKLAFAYGDVIGRELRDQQYNCLARRRRGHHARAAQRAQFRISGRGPGAGRQDGGAAHPGRAEQQRDRRRQALRLQRPGDRAATSAT